MSNSAFKPVNKYITIQNMHVQTYDKNVYATGDVLLKNKKPAYYTKTLHILYLIYHFFTETVVKIL